jgi:hypothetical protein
LYFACPWALLLRNGDRQNHHSRFECIEWPLPLATKNTKFQFLPAYTIEMNGSNAPKNKWGDRIYIPRGQQWFTIMEEEERQEAVRAEEKRRAEEAAAQRAANKLRGQREQSRVALLKQQTKLAHNELVRLNALAEAAPESVESPSVGDFKKDASGQLYRWAQVQTQGGPGYRRQRPQWYKVSKQTNYEPNLQAYLNRVRRLGTNYQTRRKNRRQSRKSRKSRRRS